MPDTKDGLYAALAKFQADIPHITKDATADAGTYSYKYADLADICKKAMPLLGKLGLAFTSKPTVNQAGQFVLAYKLTHSSGEDESGEYLLPSPEKVKAQQMGSAITYAKRYSFCAVTGIAPAGEDDDGRQAQDINQDDWRNQPTVQVQNGRVVEDVPDVSDWEVQPDDDWDAAIEAITSAEDAAAVDAELHAAFKAGKVDAGRAGKLRQRITKEAAKYQQPTLDGKLREEARKLRPVGDPT